MKAEKHRNKAHGVRYPWGDWFRRAKAPRGLTLRAGRDFAATTAGMSVMVRQAAARLGLRVSLRGSSDGRVVVRVLSPEPRGAA